MDLVDPFGRRRASLFEEIECVFEGGHGAGFPGHRIQSFPADTLALKS
jgi:hypothetical protein